MSAGIGTTAKDIALNSDGREDSSAAAAAAVPRHHRFLSLRQLNALAISLILAASGMVPASDIAVAILSFPYILFLSRFAFPPLSPSAEPPVFGPRNRLLSAYVGVAALLGLLLPVAYIFEGIMEGDKEGIRAAAPHVFLLACQVFLEGVTFSQGFSLPIRAFVPVAYNAMRMFALIEWVAVEVQKKAVAGGEGWSELRLTAGRVLAGANLLFWGFNLFGFLLPVYLPRALKRHYACKEN